MDPEQVLWIKRGETLAELFLSFGRFLKRIRGMGGAPALPIDAAATARRSAQIAVAMRNGKQLRSETLRDGARQAADAIAFDPCTPEPAPVRARSRR